MEISLIGSAKLSGLNPEGYLRDVIGRICEHPISRIEDVLPAQPRAMASVNVQLGAAVDARCSSMRMCR
jgi:IS66 C-terminal element